MDRRSPLHPLMDPGEIDRIFDRAASRLASRVTGVAVLVPSRRGPDEIRASMSESGWVEIGSLRDARGRFWYRVLWHPSTGQGRLLREWPKAQRGVLGEAVAESTEPGRR